MRTWAARILRRRHAAGNDWTFSARLPDYQRGLAPRKAPSEPVGPPPDRLAGPVELPAPTDPLRIREGEREPRRIPSAGAGHPRPDPRQARTFRGRSRPSGG